MKRLVLCFTVMIVMPGIFGQSSINSLKKIAINKQAKDFPDEIKLDSPLHAAISILYIMADGNDSLWRELSVGRLKNFLPADGAKKTSVSNEKRNLFLNATIKEILFYGDSLAYVISQYKDSLFDFRALEFENGKWLNAADDHRNSIEECFQQFDQYAKYNYLQYKQYEKIAIIPHDTATFINYLKSDGKNPKDYVLSCLEKYKLVMYGEVHRRLWSWNLCRDIIKDRRFADYVGTIFMELPSNEQENIDLFLQKKTIDKELILQVFRDVLANGWSDKGMFDFIMDVWKVNQGLPETSKIRIIAADMTRAWATLKTRQDLDKLDRFPRDTFMANLVKTYISGKNEGRHFLFIVGSGHVCKTRNEAGTILTSTLSNDDIFTIYTHAPRIEYDNPIPEKIRHGMFDLVFSKFGNNPIAFDLKNSPFGKEPFDGSLNFSTHGLWQDNFDGYIFLGSLDEEPNGEVLYDLYNEDFIKEMDRRAGLWGSNLKEWWNIKELSREAAISKILEDHTKLKWQDILKQMNPN